MSEQAEDPKMIAKYEQLADLVKAVIDDEFDLFEGEDSKGSRFYGVMVGGKCVAILPDPIEPSRPYGSVLQ